MTGSWPAERAAARRLPREDHRAEVGVDVHVGVGVGVGVGPIEFKLYRTSPFSFSKSSLNGIQLSMLRLESFKIN